MTQLSRGKLIIEPRKRRRRRYRDNRTYVCVRVENGAIFLASPRNPLIATTTMASREIATKGAVKISNASRLTRGTCTRRVFLAFFFPTTTGLLHSAHGSREPGEGEIEPEPREECANSSLAPPVLAVLKKRRAGASRARKALIGIHTPAQRSERAALSNSARVYTGERHPSASLRARNTHPPPFLPSAPPPSHPRAPRGGSTARSVIFQTRRWEPLSG